MISDFGFQIFDFGFQRNFRFWISDFSGFKVSDADFMFLKILDFGFQISVDFRFRILDYRFWKIFNFRFKIFDFSFSDVRFLISADFRVLISDC